jgi:hypothetical protein
MSVVALGGVPERSSRRPTVETITPIPRSR